jgi:hypothetical protein
MKPCPNVQLFAVHLDIVCLGYCYATLSCHGVLNVCVLYKEIMVVV